MSAIVLIEDPKAANSTEYKILSKGAPEVLK